MNRRAVWPLTTILIGVVGFAATSAALHAGEAGQRGQRGGGRGNAEARALAEPLEGVTTDGAVTSGLFSIEATGVSTAPMQAAAEAFLATLTDEQRAITMYPVDDDEWRKWQNVHRYNRFRSQ